MRRHFKALLFIGLLVTGCGDSDADLETDPAATPSVAAGPQTEETILAGFAGTWNYVAYDASGDSITNGVLVAGPGRTGWTSTFPGRDPISLEVVGVAGDSVMLRSPTYESVTTPGVQVTTQNVMRIQGDQMSGTFVSQRSVTGPDSVMRGTIRGTRQ